MVTFEPLKRLEDESQTPWLAFQVFLRMSPRSFDALAKELGLKKRTLLNYSSRFRWKERAVAWDEAVARAVGRKLLKRAEERALANFEELERIRSMAFKMLVGDEKTKGLIDDSKATLKVVTGIFFEAMKAESLVIDEALKHIDTTEDSPWNLEALTADELETFIELAKKAGGLEDEPENRLH